MAELFRRPGVANWYAWIKDPRVAGGLVKRTTKCRVKSQARTVAEELQAKVDAAIGNILAGPLLYWTDAAKIFLTLAPLKDSTRRSYDSQVKVIKESILGDFPVGDLTVDAIKVFVAERRKTVVDHGRKGKVEGQLVKDATIRRNISCMSAVIDFVIEREIEGAPEVNPFVGFNRRSLKESPLIDRNLRPEQFEAVLAACQTAEHRRIVIVLVGTGMRTGELVGLTWREVDLIAKVIEFGNLEPDRSKSSRARRVALGPIVVEALTAQSTAQKSLGKFDRDGYVFPSARKPGPRRNLSGLRKRIKRITKMDLYTNHALRSTFASWALQQGVDPLAIRDTVGHKTLSMTTRYAHHTTDSAADQIRGIVLPFTAQFTAQKQRTKGGGQSKRRVISTTSR